MGADPGGETKASNLATPTPGEPQVALIHELAKNGLSKTGHHGEVGAMGIPGPQLPRWDDIQILTAQLATKPLPDEVEVGTDLLIGRKAEKPLVLEIPLLVSDMSFGALSEEAKVALERGAELAGTGICSGEGGMLPEEQSQCSRYFYELTSAKFGYSEDLLPRVQAFHFKGGQGAKTGTGGHLPGNKVKGKIAAVRRLQEGTDAVSPATFSDLSSVADFRRFGDRVRAVTGDIPIGFKLSAQHIEEDLEFAVQAGADYIILDGRGGNRGGALDLQGSHLGSDHSGLGEGPELSGPEPIRSCFPDYHRRSPNPGRFRQGPLSRGGRHRLGQCGDAGDRVCRRPHVQYQ